MTIRAADDIDFIHSRIAEIREAEKPRCPLHPHLTLHVCLRMPEASRCSSECPHKDDWIGRHDPHPRPLPPLESILRARTAREARGMIIAGIDPGLSGAICMQCDGVFTVYDMPILALARGGKNKCEIDIHALARLFLNNRVGHAFLEQVGSMPGQGVSSVFAFGQAFGIIKGVLATAGVPFTMVPPVRWKKALQVPAAKDGARARASQLMPAAAHQWPLVKHDGRAEAALICFYGLGTLHAIAHGEAA